MRERVNLRVFRDSWTLRRLSLAVVCCVLGAVSRADDRPSGDVGRIANPSDPGPGSASAGEAGRIGNPSDVEDAAFTEAELEFFEKKVRPVLVRHCYKCHSGRAETLQAGLRLDSREAALKGGDSGPAVVPGDARASLLLDAVRYDGPEMPPDGRLAANVIADLERWIDRGAAWPLEEAATGRTDESGMDIEAGRAFWSFQPVSEMPLPHVSDPAWPRARIDHFVLAGLEKQGLRPSPPADRRTLIRRVSFDLVGLPPTYEEVEAFAADASEAAYEAVVDRLLASPHYGERWGRYWLDVARFADDHPDGEVLPPRHSHRYRDWVIRAFNEDLAYDEFVRRQLAADFVEGLPPTELAALGYLGLSPRYVKDEKFSKEVTGTIIADEWEEQIDLVTRGLLGLTVACARCHDHKFDPITTADYYALAGVMASTQLVERPLVSMFAEDAEHIAGLTWELRFHQRRYTNRFKQREGLIRDKEPDIYRYDKEILESASEIQRILSLLPEDHERIPRVDGVRDAATSIDDEFFVVRELKSPEAEFWTHVEYEAGAARDLPIHIRGSVTQLGPVVPRRFLEVLSPEGAAPFENGSGRAELAETILSDAASLAGRVIVNRVWGWHFGQPLVRTPSNFGELGDRPTHPELLDDLTARFIAGGWSVKDLHREIVCSAAYRQSSAFDPAGDAQDSAGALLWRMNRRRLDLEGWRDAMLVVAGRLRTGPGGAGEDLDDWRMSRRTVYGRISRNNPAAVLRLFDFPEATRHSEQRTATTTALQQLYYMNSPFVEAQARAVAEAALAEGGPDRTRALQAVFRRVLACDPPAAEAAAAEQLLDGLSDLDEPERWTMLAQTLLVSNRFLFVD